MTYQAYLVKDETLKTAEPGVSEDLIAQIDGLLEGLGASEDHEAVIAFLKRTGLPDDMVKRVHLAIVGAELPRA